MTYVVTYIETDGGTHTVRLCMDLPKDRPEWHYTLAAYFVSRTGKEVDRVTLIREEV